MYLSFYGLQKKPFEVNTDPSFLWLGEKHKEALATLKYGNLGNQGIILLTGDAGTGKTTLINALINSLGDDVIVAKVPDPGMEEIAFMNYISHAFGMNKKFVSKDAFLIHFNHFLNSIHAAGKKSLLIIDEAQRLSPALLEEVRQLSNIEKQGIKLLSIFFVGHKEFNDVLLEHKNRALRQRISLNYVIEPLDLHETGEFIRHRLNVAGAEGEIFSPDAIRNVYEFSGGFPRRVNIICDHALLLGFGESTKTVTGEIVKECTKDLLLPQFSKNKSNESLQSVAIADSKNVEEIPSERALEVSSGNSWKTFGIVVLVAMAVFIVTFIMYPGKYQDLVFRGNNNAVQSYGGESGTNSLSATSHPKPDTETAAIESVDTSTETKIADADAKEVLAVEEPVVEDVNPVSAGSAEDRPDAPKETLIVPDLINNGAGIPGDGKGRIIDSSFHSAKMGASSNLNHENPSNEETLKTPVISETDVIEQPVMTITPADSAIVPPLQVNPQNQTTDQVTESLQPVSAGARMQGVETVPGQDDPKKVKGALGPKTHSQSSSLADEEVKTTNVTDNFASGVSDETETERVEPVEPSGTDNFISKEQENQDPGALIDWVIKKRSK